MGQPGCRALPRRTSRCAAHGVVACAVTSSEKDRELAIKFAEDAVRRADPAHLDIDPEDEMDLIETAELADEGLPHLPVKAIRAEL